MAKQFSGKIELDVRDSVADWDAFIPSKAPTGSPNVLVVLYDDTGQAAWSPYGGRIQMPTMERLAANGLTYSQWHTTALCSPTRSTFLTGRNHHANGFASISESSTGFPGYSSHIPPENATMANVLRDCRVVDVLGRQEPQRPDRRVDGGRLEEELAARAGLRPVLRLHRR
ncbi:sulfatase-like hydrolase/transferase [Sphingomonas sp. LR61]|uniref:sulfatase-like hydrolase/transferase n=1 Tax=Sphingomonas sp. LR61 TaxID=3050234 RepID=UPI002FE3D7CA